MKKNQKLTGISVFKMDSKLMLKQHGWDWLLKYYRFDYLKDMYIDYFGRNNYEYLDISPVKSFEGIFAVVIGELLYENECLIYENEEGNHYISKEDYFNFYNL
ncbi:MAG: hypothetical protein ACFE8B_15790 [Candidatus Hermodarchaeota archaeon]